jgi:hypothetical protein
MNAYGKASQPAPGAGDAGTSEGAWSPWLERLERRVATLETEVAELKHKTRCTVGDK